MKPLSFFKGLSWLLLLNLLIKPVWIFFIDRQVQNIAGNEAYGRYFAVLNLSYVLFFLADAGLSNMLNQRVAQRTASNLRQLLRIKCMLLAVYGLIFCFVGWLTHIRQWNLLLYVLLIQGFTSLFTFLRSIITAHQFFTTDAWFSVVDKFLMTLICGFILYGSFPGSMSLVLFLRIQFFCTAIAVVLAAAFLVRKRVFEKGNNESIEKIVQLLIPFALIILLMSVHYRLDGFLLERIHLNGPLEAGIYASAYRLLDAANMIGYLTASFLVPFIARNYGDETALKTTVLYTRHGLLFCAIGLVCFVVVYAPWLQQVLYHNHAFYQTRVLQLCIAALPGYFLVHIYGSVLTATRRFRSFIAVLLGAVVVNIVLNLFLIPVYGALGCCIAAICSQYLCGITCCLVVKKELHVPVGFRSVAVYLLSTLILTGLFYWGQSTVSNVWIILAIIAGTICILLATQFRNFKKYLIAIR